MFCRNCGKELIGAPEICIGCGARPLVGNSFCQACGAATDPLAEICMKCGVRIVKAKAEVGERKWMPTTAGILSIIAGVITFFLFSLVAATDGPEGVAGAIFGLALIAIGIVAIVGGVFALRRRIWGLALAGAICSVPGSLILGIPAVVFVVMSKQEFK